MGMHGKARIAPRASFITLKDVFLFQYLCVFLALWTLVKLFYCGLRNVFGGGAFYSEIENHRRSESEFRDTLVGNY